MNSRICLIFCILFIFSSHTVLSQKKRYYPSLSSLLSDQGDPKIGEEFSDFNSWIDEVIDHGFYKDLQYSVSPKGDAAFYSMGLIMKKKNQFSLHQPGFELVFNEGQTDFSEPISISYSDEYKVLAYLRGFNPDLYDPADLHEKFQLGLMILNISQEQALAQFLNNFTGDKTEIIDHKTISALLKDLQKYARKKFGKIKIESEDPEELTLKFIVTEIYRQTETYASSVLYEVYIRDKDLNEEHKKFNKFFKSFIPQQASAYIDDIVSYKSTLNIKDGLISLIIPNSILQPQDSTGNDVNATISLNPQQINFETVYNVQGNFLKIEMAQMMKINADNRKNFLIKDEATLNPFRTKQNEGKPDRIYETADIEAIQFEVHSKQLKVSLMVSNSKMSFNYGAHAVLIYDGTFAWNDNGN